MLEAKTPQWFIEQCRNTQFVVAVLQDLVAGMGNVRALIVHPYLTFTNRVETQHGHLHFITEYDPDFCKQMLIFEKINLAFVYMGSRGWRNALEVITALRDASPDVKIVALVPCEMLDFQVHSMNALLGDLAAHDKISALLHEADGSTAMTECVIAWFQRDIHA